MDDPENTQPGGAQNQYQRGSLNATDAVAQNVTETENPSRQALTSSKIPQASTANNQARLQSPPRQRVQPTSRQMVAQSLDGVVEGTKERLIRPNPHSPSWPTSPRLKSPPPGATRSPYIRRENTEQPQSNTAKRLATVSAPELAAAILLPESQRDQSQLPSSSHLRVPPRGNGTHGSGLETVEESSVPETPSVGSLNEPIENVKPENPTADGKSETASTHTSLGENRPAESVSQPTTQNTENDSKIRTPSSSRPPTSLAKRSFTNLTGTKKQSSDPMRTMTVETETVASMPQLLGDRARDGGSVRTKASSETIRPKKDKKKSTRKTPSLYGGSGTTRADIFEAKVASAVDEVETSDSEETFVYESNPPEPRSARHHSRTPSATSLASTAEQFGRNKHGIRSGSNAVSGKKSMKFSNSGYRDPEDQEASRNSSRNGSSAPRPHHIGRYGRNGHPSLFDNDSPFATSAKPTSPLVSTGSPNRGGPGSKPNSLRVTGGRPGASPRKYGGTAYNHDEDAADDERAPLIGSVRVSRARHNKRPHSRDLRAMDTKHSQRPQTWSKFGMCGLTIILTFLLCVAIATFVLTLNRPLVDVEIRHLQNILASEQEIMLDLDVRAVNPNLFSITVNDLDVELFAVSPYAGTNRHWNTKLAETRKLRSRRRGDGEAAHDLSWFWPEPVKPHDGVDEGTDPDDDSGSQKLLLGTVLFFDSPLTFEAAPIRRDLVSSVGEIRLAKPGNGTSPGGSSRWERVVQHEFDLIVRGVIQYNLPLSSRMHSAKVSGRRTVYPDGEEKTFTGRSLT